MTCSLSRTISCAVSFSLLNDSISAESNRSLGLSSSLQLIKPAALLQPRVAHLLAHLRQLARRPLRVVLLRQQLRAPPFLRQRRQANLKLLLDLQDFLQQDRVVLFLLHLHVHLVVKKTLVEVVLVAVKEIVDHHLIITVGLVVVHEPFKPTYYS